jgi:transcriptional regulator with XRE-family HTH domain
MTPAAFRELTKDLGFTTGDVAVLMGVTRRTPQLWLTGQSPIPQSVSILLRAIKDGLIPLEWVEDRILETIKLS